MGFWTDEPVRVESDPKHGTKTAVSTKTGKMVGVEVDGKWRSVRQEGSKKK